MIKRMVGSRETQRKPVFGGPRILGTLVKPSFSPESLVEALELENISVFALVGSVYIISPENWP